MTKTWMSGRSLFILTLALIALSFLFWGGGIRKKVEHVVVGHPIDKPMLAQALGEALTTAVLPEEVTVNRGAKLEKIRLTYTFEEGLQKEMQGLFDAYKPDYGSFVALDATTGRVLSMLSWNPSDPWIKDHLALRATFPSASVFKVVTAAAAISEKKMRADSIVSFNGRAHTLYKNHVFSEARNRWTTNITLRQAFARSVNTVFGRIGAFTVGPAELKTYADRFGFNRPINADIPVQQGRAMISEDPWEIAEAASGYTRSNTMSPLQGAMIAAAIANDGRMMEPYVVQQATNTTGEVVYTAQPSASTVVIDTHAAEEMRELMRETVRTGTSRRTFSGFRAGPFGFVDVGGKTGSLSGADPEGKYDWFVGYGSAGDQKIAVAALTISKQYWKVKSGFLARRAMENYFKEKFGLNTVAGRSLAQKRTPNRYVRSPRPRRHRR